MLQISTTSGRNPLRSIGSTANVMSYANQIFSRRTTRNRSVGPVVPDVVAPSKTSRLARVAEVTSQSSIAVAGLGTLFNGVTNLIGLNVR